MARTTRSLTNTEVLRAKALEKDLTLHDGDGLFLIVKTSGKKLWRFRYQRPATKQRTMMGLGAFPALSLTDARGIRADYLALLANGIDPQIQAEVAEEQQQIALDSIFSTVAANWFQLKSKSVTPDYAKDIWRPLEKTYSLPSGKFLSSKSKPEHWLKPLSQSKHVEHSSQCAGLCSVLTR